MVDRGKHPRVAAVARHGIVTIYRNPNLGYSESRLSAKSRSISIPDGRRGFMESAKTGMSRCGIVLAGGDGRRLEAFVRRLRGDALPKQYVDFSGNGSLLEQTFRRAERLIPARRLFTVVSRNHFAYPEVWRQLADRPGGRVVAQPENKDTAPGLLLPLARVSREYGDATVVVFPSDHAIGDDAAFMAHVELACEAVEARPSRMVLLGVSPTAPEADYGYVVPGEAGSDRLRVVTRFVEKPGATRAAELIERGALWNSFVMVFRADTLWEYVESLTPSLAAAFRRLAFTPSPKAERAEIDDVYRRIQPVNFSSAFLRRLPGLTRPALMVLDMGAVGWTDCGVEARLSEAIREPIREPITDPIPLCA
jgi:mannose-1-phosphate guanylyltransferase